MVCGVVDFACGVLCCYRLGFGYCGFCWLVGLVLVIVDLWLSVCMVISDLIAWLVVALLLRVDLVCFVFGLWWVCLLVAVGVWYVVL